MATASSPSPILDDTNLEAYSLVWLDPSELDTNEARGTQERLRKLINHIVISKDVDTCEQHIRSIPKEEQIILVVNGQLAREIVSRIHPLQQVFSIYIYSMEKKRNEQWIKDCSKVKGVTMELDALVTQISSDQAARVHNKVDEPLSINIFNATGQKEQSTTELNGQFLHSQLLIDCLLRMAPKSTDKNELINLCKTQYKDNASELAILTEFERDYSPDRALWWYTRESFLYRLLNKALRVQNIDLLFLFRFFIRDIRNQLEQYQYATPVRVYRGQLISNEELEVLKTSMGQFITMNSFLSTSFDRRLALSFLTSSTASDDLQRVLFEIDIDPTLSGIKPCADITAHSFFTGEQELLIMLGSIFRLVNIDSEKKVWVIQITMCSDNDNNLKPIFKYMKDEYCEGDEESSLVSFGTLLFKMGKLDKAENYYHRLLKELPDDHEDLPTCYHNLAMIDNHKGDYDTSLQWFNKALEIYTKTKKSNDPVLAVTHNSVGEVYLRKGNRKGALESFNKALIIRKQAFGEDNLDVAKCYQNIGNVYQEEKKLQEAFEYHQKALIIRQKHLPPDHPDLSASLNCLASIYLCFGQLDAALQYYNMALKIYQKSLPADHPNVAMAHYNLGLIYDFKCNFQQSVSNFQKGINNFPENLTINTSSHCSRSTRYSTCFE